MSLSSSRFGVLDVPYRDGYLVIYAARYGCPFGECRKESRSPRLRNHGQKHFGAPFEGVSMSISKQQPPSVLISKESFPFVEYIIHISPLGILITPILVPGFKSRFCNLLIPWSSVIV